MSAPAAAAAAAPTTTNLKVGLRVVVASRVGTVRFAGSTKFAAGLWIGVELDEQVGKNNGVVQGVEYFNCKPEHGIFVRANLVQTLEDAEAAGAVERRSSRKSSTASVARTASDKAGDVARTPSDKSATEAASPGTPAKAASPAASPKAAASAAQSKAASPTSASQAEARLSVSSTTSDKGGKLEQAKQTLESHRSKVQQAREKVVEIQKLFEKEKAQLQAAEAKLAEAQASQKPPEDPEAAAVAKQLLDMKAAVEKQQSAVDANRAEVGKLEDANKRMSHEAELMQPGGAAEGPEKIPELKAFLQKIVLEKDLQDQRAIELKLQLDELKLMQEEEKALAAANAQNATSVFAANSWNVSEYQSALKALHTVCAKDQKELREKCENLEREADKMNGLKHKTESLTRRQQELQEGIIESEKEATELLILAQTGEQLQDAHASMETEFRRQLEAVDARVERFGALVLKLHKEKIDAESAIAADSIRANELSLELQRLAADDKQKPEDVGDDAAMHRHTRMVTLAVRQRLGALAASAANCRAEAFMGCIPENWIAGTPEKTASVDREALVKVKHSASVISMVESCLCRAEALSTYVCTDLLPSLRSGNEQTAKWLCVVCLVCGSCAAAAGSALGRLRALPPESEQKLKATQKAEEVIITETEGNLGLSVKGVPPAKTLPVQKVAPGSLAAKHEVKAGSTLIAVQGKTTEKMKLEDFKTCMKERPLHLLLRPPQMEEKKSTLNLNMDMVACEKARSTLDSLLAACKTGPPQPQPEALEIVSALEQQFKALEHAADASTGQVVSRCVTVMALRRLEAIYRFGLLLAPAGPEDEEAEIDDDEASEAEGDEQRVSRRSSFKPKKSKAKVRQELTQRLSEVATRLEAVEAARELSVSSGHPLGAEERGLPEDVLKELLSKLQSLEGVLRSGGGSIVDMLDEAAAAVAHGLDETSNTWRAGRRGSASSGGPFFAPGWTGCAASVRREIDQVFEVQHQVVDGRENLVEQKRALEDSKKRLEDATQRKAELQKKVDELREKCQECTALDAEALTLHGRAKEDTKAQAKLQRELDGARSGREDQERASRDCSAKLAVLERDLEERRRRPQQELEGRATAQELATLRHRSVKGARDLYALQVDSIRSLPALPPPASVRSATARALESCVAGHAELRRELLFEWAGTRLTKLQPAAEASQATRPKPLLDPVDTKVGRIQQLQVQLNELRATAAPLAEGVAVPSSPSPAPAAGTSKTPAVQVKLELPCPRWVAMPPATNTPLAVTFQELHRMHAVMV